MNSYEMIVKVARVRQLLFTFFLVNMYLAQDNAEIRLFCSHFHETVSHHGLNE